MQLSTFVPLPDIPFPITYESPVFLMGSCFSDVFGDRLNRSKFQVLSNPFGTVYNPLSIGKMIQHIVDNHVPEIGEIQSHNGIFFHPDYHSDLSSLSRDETYFRIQQATGKANEFLKAARSIFITFGSAYVYTEKSTGHFVANCHKLPGNLFDKKLLSIHDICRDAEKMISKIRANHPEIPVVFTVSPVRHIRDGLIENNRSKARLLEAVHQLKENVPEVYYFPSYELVIDQLHDYRFYEKDLIHPNELAHDVIWNIFADTFFEPPTRQIIARVEKIVQAYRHRPRLELHQDYISFCKKQVEEIYKLKEIINLIDFSEELSYFTAKSDLYQD